MFRAKDRDRGKEQFWRRMVQRWHRSGLSVRAFCVEQGLSEPSFYGWRRTVAERDAAAVRFVPVRVVAEATNRVQAATPEPSGGELELVLDSGRRVRIRPGFDTGTLQRLLALLEEGRS